MMFRVQAVAAFGPGREEWVEVSLHREADEVCRDVDFKVPWPAAARVLVGDAFDLSHVERPEIVGPADTPELGSPG